MNKLIIGVNDLATHYPDLAAEWHHEKNKGISPQNILPGCNKKYWWRCKEGHEWEATPNHRTQRGDGCPYCSHRKMDVAFSLAAMFPDIAKEWNYEKNIKSPNEYPAYANDSVFWKCGTCGHVWKTSIGNRSNLGSGCPACKNLVIIPGRNDLATANPVLAEEWDYDKNQKTPSEVGAGSPQRVWWKCEYGHSWQAPIRQRYRGTGCPVCIKYKKHSFPEFMLYYYINMYFPDAEHSYKHEKLKNKEIDIYIPSTQTGVEYDGGHWHKSASKDIEKDEICISAGISLIRVRESGCMLYERSAPTFVLQDTSVTSLQKAITDVLFCLGVKKTEINVASDYTKIRSLYHAYNIKSSMAEQYPELAKQWHPTLNGDLDPNRIPCTMSKEKYYWLCPTCNSTWKAPLQTRIRKSGGNGCPVCAGKVVKAGINDLASQYPLLAEEWHPDRNGSLRPDNVHCRSHIKAWWKCNKGHEWEATIRDRASGNGCPICSGKRVLQGYNDLATIIPELIDEWDFSNNKKTPFEITAHSGYMANWICKTCGHHWNAQVNSRARGTGCPVCGEKKKGKRKKQ